MATMNIGYMSAFGSPVLFCDEISGGDLPEAYFKTFEGRWIEGGSSSGYEDVLNEPGFEDLKKNLTIAADYYLFEHLQIKRQYNIEFVTSWPTRTPPGAGHGTMHFHENAQFSGVWYPKFTSPKSHIAFASIVPGWAPELLKPTIETANDHNTDRILVEAKGERVVFFPSKLCHAICENESETNRYSVAFNIILNGEYTTNTASLYIQSRPLSPDVIPGPKPHTVF